MRDILFITPVFCPNQAGYEVNMRSIKSIFEYTETYECVSRIEFVFIGWCKDECFWSDIMHYLSNKAQSDTRYKIHIIKKEENFGKARVVNEAFEKYYTIQKHFITCDSDIVFDIKEENVIGRMINLSGKIEPRTNKKVGYLAFAQNEADCHLHNDFDKVEIFDDELVKWASHGGSIAGGALYINPEAFVAVGKYREMGCYAGDDGWLLADLNTKGYFTAVVDTIAITHPHGEIKPGYHALKHDNRLHTDNTGSSYNKNFEMMKEFWNSSP